MKSDSDREKAQTPTLTVVQEPAETAFLLTVTGNKNGWKVYGSSSPPC